MRHAEREPGVTRRISAMGPDAVDPLALLRHARDALLARIVEALSADARVAAAWLSGSFGRDEADAWSDLDLHVAVADEHLEAFLTERPQLYARVGRSLLVQGEMPSDSQPAAWFQLVWFAGPVEVDWNIGPVGRAERPAASLVVFDRSGIPLMTPPPLTEEQRRARAAERLTFFWAMAPIAVKFAGRGETRRAGRQIELMTNAYISLWRLVHQPHGPEPYLPATNRPLEPELEVRLPELGQTVDRTTALDVIARLCHETETLHPALTALGISIPAEMPGEVRRLGAVADDAVRQGNLPRRRFR